MHYLNLIDRKKIIKVFTYNISLFTKFHNKDNLRFFIFFLV